MALIGPTPTAAFVQRLVVENEGEKLFEVFNEVFEFTDGPIFKNLASNDLTRKKLLNYLTPQKLREFFPQIENISDPQFYALAILAESSDKLCPTIIELVSENPKKECLTILAKLLYNGKLDTKKSISDKLLDKILTFVHVESDYHWKSLATLVIKACHKTHKQYILNYIKIHLGEGLGFSAANAVFAEIPEIKDIVFGLKFTNNVVDPSFFKLLSSFCNDKDDRLKVSQNFLDIINQNSGNLLAMVVKAKLLAGQTSQTLGDIAKARQELDDLSLKFEENVNEDTLEGLVCTSRLLTVRQRAAGDTKAKKVPSLDSLKGPALNKKIPTMVKTNSTSLVNKLVELLKGNPTLTSFPVTAILCNLAKYPIKMSSEEEKSLKMHQQVFGETVFDADQVKLMSKEGVAEVMSVSSANCLAILETNVIQWYTLNGPKISSNCREQLALLIRELSAHQKRSLKYKIAVQGGALVAMYLYVEKRPQPISALGKLFACSALARILLSIEPQVALTAKVNVTQVVRPLVDLIRVNFQEDIATAYEGTAISDIDTFEALLALTNLSGVGDRTLRIEICRNVYSFLPKCLSHVNPLIVRGALELCCNLMLVPQGAGHFLQRDVKSKELLTVLGLNVVSKDRASRLAASGALAILAEWETAAEQIGTNTECMEGLCHAMGLFPDDDDTLVRVLTALKIIIKTTTDDLDDEVAERIIYFEGLAHMEELVETLDPGVHREVGALLVQCMHLLAKYKLT